MTDYNTDFMHCPYCGGLIEAGGFNNCVCIDEDDWALYDEDYHNQVHHREEF